jgi:hypothetical protein
MQYYPALELALPKKLSRLLEMVISFSWPKKHLYWQPDLSSVNQFQPWEKAVDWQHLNYSSSKLAYLE